MKMTGRHYKSVGLKKPNSFGLYDMSGNVGEQVWDWYGDYNSQSSIDLVGPSNSGNMFPARVNRGGG